MIERICCAVIILSLSGGCASLSVHEWELRWHNCRGHKVSGAEAITCTWNAPWLSNPQRH